MDDYNELIFVQSLLQKTGFNVDGTRGERGFTATFLRFNPDVVLFSMKTHGFGLKLLKQVKQRPGTIVLVPKVVIDKLDQMRELAEADIVLETPARPTDLLTNLADLGALSAEPILEKYHKIRSTLGPTEVEGSAFRDISGTGEEPPPRSRRAERIKDTLAKLEKPQHNGFSKRDVQDTVKRIRQEEASTNRKDLDEERRAFVKAMFKPPSS